MNSESDTETKTSKKRVVGSALFAFVSALYIQNAAYQTIPAIMVMTQKTDIATAQANYDASDLLHSTIMVGSAFVGAVTAGFLARRKGIWAGILADSPYILFLGYVLFLSIAGGHSDTFSQLPLADVLSTDTSFWLGILLRLALVILAASIGGLVGQRLYSPDRDLDLGQEKITIFGVRWPHYFWIIPLIYLAFLASAIIILYAGAAALVADFSFAWHPSLWFNLITRFIFLPLAPFLVYVAGWITARGFVRFFEVMQYRQKAFNGWKKLWRVFVFGVGAPAVSYTIAALGADAAHAIPKPAEGDWKVAVGLIAIVLVIGCIGSLISKMKGKASA
jgi:hypothetical protein